MMALEQQLFPGALPGYSCGRRNSCAPRCRRARTTPSSTTWCSRRSCCAQRSCGSRTRSLNGFLQPLLSFSFFLSRGSNRRSSPDILFHYPSPVSDTKLVSRQITFDFSFLTIFPLPRRHSSAPANKENA